MKKGRLHTTLRPERWDKPFSDTMTDSDIDDIMSIEPFASMDVELFPVTLPLRKIIHNDMQIKHFSDKEIVYRRGDYGHSAFLILEGNIQVSQIYPEKLVANVRSNTKNRKGPFAKLAQLWKNSNIPEVREFSARHNIDDTPRIIVSEKALQDEDQTTLVLGPGEIIGEDAPIDRRSRLSNVFATGPVKLLEIRWQGLRDIMRYVDSFNHFILERYQKRSQRSYLRRMSLFGSLDDHTIDLISQETLYEQYGVDEWYRTYKKLLERPIAERLAQEPIIVSEGDYVDGLLIIKSAFCRTSVKADHGDRTIGYLRFPDVFGLEELAHNWLTGESIPAQKTLRAIGCVDILRIPSSIIEQYVLPVLLKEKKISPLKHISNKKVAAPKNVGDSQAIDQDLLEFMVDNRYINGTATMVIDTDRCVRCDECVRACEITHDNNPRFIRQGKQLGKYAVINACMHCADPVCMVGCPTDAIHRDEKGGQVVIDPDTCIGCGVCAANCPYDVITMVDIRNSEGNLILDEKTNIPLEQATKCDLCIDQKNGPACVRACAHDALKRVDMSDITNLIEWIKQK